ncbi:MAG TPA: S8 family serine peptidase [Thermoanaerobaculia bacterium]|jgi:subtilisin family serine protease
MNRALGLLLGTALLAAQALPLSGEETGRYLIAPREQARAPRLRAMLRERVRAFPAVNAYAADLTGEEAAALASSGDVIVERVVPRHAFEAAPAPATPLATIPEEIPWGVTDVGAPQVWAVTRGENVNVVVIDTGIDVLHPDLADAYRGGFNAVEPGELPLDGHKHGTHVAGTIAAGQNGFGVVGVAPGARLWAVKALDDDGNGSSETVVAAFEWVLAKAKTEGGRWVINTSLGSASPSEVEKQVISQAIADGIVVVASVGNTGLEGTSFPASYPGVIGVGATAPTGLRANFSSYGRGLTVLAPGTAVRSTFNHGALESLDLNYSDGSRFPSWIVKGAPYKKVTGKVIDCGVGEPHEFPPSVRGEIALVRRGKYFFYEMARNAKAAGAAALIIETYASDNGAHNWSFHPTPDTPEWKNFSFPLAVGVKYAVGEEILGQPGEYTIEYATEIYGLLNGTSMAAPHVAGAAALMLSLAPDLSPAWVAAILRYTARDLYTAGWDLESGWGALDALKAGQWVAPEKFGVPAPPPPHLPRRRSVR